MRSSKDKENRADEAEKGLLMEFTNLGARRKPVEIEMSKASNHQSQSVVTNPETLSRQAVLGNVDTAPVDRGQSCVEAQRAQPTL
ncbi:hypothetical protein DL769_005682 [Monosporascus sp. CRB-8-3]|nr:hypothetical protein DL769_005682 [Monosporascus sp. CRB-8-3]